MLHLSSRDMASSPNPGPTSSPAQPRPPPIFSVDANNHITRPNEAANNLTLGEGSYTLRDVIKLGVVPAAPIELGSPTTNNVLDTRLPPPTAGSRLSTVILAPRGRPKAIQGKRGGAPDSRHSNLQNLNDGNQDASHSGSDTGSSVRNSYNLQSLAAGNIRTKVFGDSNAANALQNSKDGSRRKKPKTNVVKSNSSLVARAVPSEHLTKRLNEHKPEGIYVFVNTSRAFIWLDLSATIKTDNFMKITFTKAHPLCHDVNGATKVNNHIDVIVGFSSSDIIWYEPFSQRYTRINKNGVINASPVRDIRWVPGSENFFLAAHADGHLILYDKDREDAPNLLTFADTNTITKPDKPRIVVKSSMQSGLQKLNPVSCWKVAKRRINGLSFSPDGQYIAVVSDDGALRIIDYAQEKLMDLYQSYYGGFSCVCWSPDGHYILTGGQDDLLSLWSFDDRSLVARFQGQRSWVTSVAFDPWRCDDKSYRLGSVGEDGRLVLWDFATGLLTKRITASSASIRGASVASGAHVFPAQDYSSGLSTASVEQPSSTLVEDDGEVVNHDEPVHHPTEARGTVPMFPAIMSKKVDEHGLSWLTFEEDCIITACESGHIRTWERPEYSEDKVPDLSSGNLAERRDNGRG